MRGSLRGHLDSALLGTSGGHSTGLSIVPCWDRLQEHGLPPVCQRLRAALGRGCASQPFPAGTRPQHPWPGTSSAGLRSLWWEAIVVDRQWEHAWAGHRWPLVQERWPASPARGSLTLEAPAGVELRSKFTKVRGPSALSSPSTGWSPAQGPPFDDPEDLPCDKGLQNQRSGKTMDCIHPGTRRRSCVPLCSCHSLPAP